jgi:tetratricopeptide (TPR) repeat protein
MNVFIVRPFGEKPVLASESEKRINFDKVQKQLIDPVLQERGISGGTTAEIAQAGNIRTDMFQKLLTADLVIADISIHNANVYYELGIRHALRKRATILIRCRGDEVPFDLKTDRYLDYDPENLAATRPQLSRMIEETLLSQTADSPVHQLLPKLEEHDPSFFITIPQDFREAVEQAKAEKDLALLGLLATEIRGLEWYRQGLKEVGLAQFALKAWKAARTTLEAVRSEKPDDFDANLLLGTIYQRLGDLTRSSQAIERVLQRSDLDNSQRSEPQALEASNTKTLWLEDWKKCPQEQRQSKALNGLLEKAIAQYQAAFAEDQNHYYSGLNALALVTVLLELARAQPESWDEGFPDSDEAARKLKDYKQQRLDLAGAVKYSLDAANLRQQRTGKPDNWLKPSWADYYLLTSNKPKLVQKHYKDAKDAGAAGFTVEAAARQIGIYLDLGILQANSRAALEGLEVTEKMASEAQPETAKPPRDRLIVSTGHRVDYEGRVPPRFPGDPQSVAKARQAIFEAVQAEKALTNGQLQGISGAASGNDLLFHEVCEELQIPTQVILAIPENEYLQKSVSDGGSEWVEKFRRLCQEHSPRILSEKANLPSWVRNRQDYGVFQRSNIWMLEYAFSQANTDVTLIALWNGQAGDGPGGTADMVKLAEERGAKVVRIDTQELFTLHS